ncbi:unnamed protein product, partial [Adineta steineri]
VINECPPLPEKQPPLILREEPPIPPPIIPSETITKYLPAIPAPARSVLIKRYPALPTRPRDILIERWLPYGPRPQRETITYPAPPAISYPEPFFRIIQYEAGHASIHHRFEKLFARENPEYYRTRYGSSLLDTATLLRLAREAGVSEDLTLPPAPPLVPGYGGFGGTHDYHMYGGGNQYYHGSTQSGNYSGSYPYAETLRGQILRGNVGDGNLMSRYSGHIGGNVGDENILSRFSEHSGGHVLHGSNIGFGLASGGQYLH